MNLLFTFPTPRGRPAGAVPPEQCSLRVSSSEPGEQQWSQDGGALVHLLATLAQLCIEEPVCQRCSLQQRRPTACIDWTDIIVSSSSDRFLHGGHAQSGHRFRRGVNACVNHCKPIILVT